MADDLEAVKEKLTSEWWEAFYRFNYGDIATRQSENGFFRESVSGGYPLGYWARTCGPLVKLWLNTGEVERARQTLNFVLEVTAREGKGRVPHVIGPQAKYMYPVEGSDVAVQTDMSIPLYRLDEPYSAAQSFKAPEHPIRAVEVGIGGGIDGRVTLTIRPKMDGDILAKVVREGDFSQVRMERFELDAPLQLEAGRRYYIQLTWEGRGNTIWFGIVNADRHPLAGTMARDDKKKYTHADHVTAFALDTGTLKHVVREVIPVLSWTDQIDGQAHVILAWALYAQRVGDTDFVKATYDLVAGLTDASFGPTYFSSGIIHNANFEHHREGRFWNTSDMLSQAFCAQAIREMIKVAESRGDTRHATSWNANLAALETAIPRRLSWELDGERIYAEMLKEGSSAEVFHGLSWVNLAPTASGWKGYDPLMYDRTIEAYTRHATFEWKGHRVLSIDYTEGRPPERTVIGKGVGWEMLYHAERGNWKRVSEILDFVFDAHEGQAERRYGEAFHMPSEDGKIVHQDPGNGEQTTWFLYCLSEVRKLTGLDPKPSSRSALE